MFSPSGELLVGNFRSSENTELVVWETSTGKRRLSTRNMLGGWVGRPGWSHDEKRLALTVFGGSSTIQGRVLLWDLTTNQQILSLEGPENSGFVNDLIFGPSDNSLYCLAIGSEINLIKWDAPKLASDGK
jgi:WD40 repeat protein